MDGGRGGSQRRRPSVDAITDISCNERTVRTPVAFGSASRWRQTERRQSSTSMHCSL